MYRYLGAFERAKVKRHDGFPVCFQERRPFLCRCSMVQSHLATAGVARNLRADTLRGKNNSRIPFSRKTKSDGGDEAQSLTSAHTRAIPGASLSRMVRISSDVGVANGLAGCVGSHPPAHSHMHAKSTSNSFGVRALIYARLTLPASGSFRLKVRTRY